jgi:hypothetical protein
MRRFHYPFLAIFWLLLGLGTTFVAAENTAAMGDAPDCHPSKNSTTNPQASAAAPAAIPVKVPSTEVWPPQVTVPIQESDAVSKDGARVKTVLFKDMPIDRIYPSMRGPWTRKYVSLDPAHTSPFLWITSYRAEILDGVTGSASQEFMCHTNMDLAGAAGSANAFRRIRSELSISQGQKETDFPKGYALRIEDRADSQMDVNVMVLNNNYADIHKKLDFKVTIQYVDDQTAQTKKMTPLFESAVGIDCPTEAAPTNGEDTVCEPASAFLVAGGPGKRTGHWLVPPGRQVLRANAGRGLGLGSDTTTHYIWMHVHPYAESMELVDKTTGKSVWKGSVKNDPHKAIVENTEHYSDPKGLMIYKDHDYEVISTYNNPTDHKIDAMAALWMYFKDKS